MKYYAAILGFLLIESAYLYAQEISASESFGSGGNFYYIDDEQAVNDWYETCSGVESGHGPPLNQTYKIQTTDLSTVVKLGGCFQECDTGKIFCSSISVESISNN